MPPPPPQEIFDAWRLFLAQSETLILTLFIVNMFYTCMRHAVKSKELSVQAEKLLSGIYTWGNNEVDCNKRYSQTLGSAVAS